MCGRRHQRWKRRDTIDLPDSGNVCPMPQSIQSVHTTTWQPSFKRGEDTISRPANLDELALDLQPTRINNTLPHMSPTKSFLQANLDHLALHLQPTWINKLNSTSPSVSPTESTEAIIETSPLQQKPTFLQTATTVPANSFQKILPNPLGPLSSN